MLIHIKLESGPHVAEEAIGWWHNLWGLVSNKLPKSMFCIFLPFWKISRISVALFFLVTLTSGLVQILRASCIPQIPTATSTVAKSGNTSGLNHQLSVEEAIEKWGEKPRRTLASFLDCCNWILLEFFSVLLGVFFFFFLLYFHLGVKNFCWIFYSKT